MALSIPPRPFTERSAGVLASMMDFAVASHVRAVLILLALAFVALVPGVFQIPALDREEVRVAQASKQMLETGDFFAIRFQDDISQGQPVGVNWLQAGLVHMAEVAGFRSARTTIWLYRLPSLLGAIGAVLLTYWAALVLVSRRAALLAALMLAASVAVGIEARLAKGETVLLMISVLAMGALARIYIGAYRGAPPSRGLAALFWTALALGVLVNGSVLPLIAGLCILSLVIADRSTVWLPRLYPGSGGALFVGLLLPWALFLALRRGEVLPVLLVHDLFELAVGETGHRALPGSYTLLFFAMFWPGAALAGLAAPAVWKARHEPGARMLLAWLVPAWIVFELMLTKLPHFVLPLYPAAAILIAGIVDPHVLARARWLVRGTMWWFVFPVVASVAGIATMMLVGRQLGLLAWPFAAGATIFGLLAWRLYEVDGATNSVIRAVASSVLLFVGAFGVMLPSLGVLFPATTIAEAARSRRCPEPVAASAGFQEPSIVFRLGTKTRLTDGAGAAEFLNTGSCRFAVVESRHQRAFGTYADRVGLRYVAGPRIETYNFNAGRWMTLNVFYTEDFR